MDLESTRQRGSGCINLKRQLGTSQGGTNGRLTRETSCGVGNAKLVDEGKPAGFVGKLDWWTWKYELVLVEVETPHWWTLNSQFMGVEHSAENSPANMGDPAHRRTLPD